MPKKQKKSTWRIWWGGSSNKEEKEGKKDGDTEAAEKVKVCESLTKDNTLSLNGYV